MPYYFNEVSITSFIMHQKYFLTHNKTDEMSAQSSGGVYLGPCFLQWRRRMHICSEIKVSVHILNMRVTGLN